jgi:hypothetical protein
MPATTEPEPQETTQDFDSLFDSLPSQDEPETHNDSDFETETEPQEPGQNQNRNQLPAQREVNPDVIADRIVEKLKPTPTEPQEDPQVAEAKFREDFGSHQVDAELIETLYHGGDKAVAALQGLLDKTTVFAVNIALARMTNMVQEQLAAFQPLLQDRQRAVADSASEEFFTANPDLNLDQHGELLATIWEGMKAQKVAFKTKEEAFNAVAAKARTMLGLPQQNRTAPQQRKPSGVPAMPTLAPSSPARTAATQNRNPRVQINAEQARQDLHDELFGPRK